MPKSEATILVADDEADIRDMIGTNLSSAGFRVIKAEDGDEALQMAREHSPSVAVLDVMMPGLSGLEVCREMKRDSATAMIAVVLVSAKGNERDRISGLEFGADDYVTKPFSPRELTLRIQAILRSRVVLTAPPALQRAGEVLVDHERHLTLVRGRPVDLTPIEFGLLSVLVEKPGHVLSRNDLLHRIWGHEKYIETRTVDTHMRRLRDKLGPAAELIQTVRGFGYRLKP